MYSQTIRPARPGQTEAAPRTWNSGLSALSGTPPPALQVDDLPQRGLRGRGLLLVVEVVVGPGPEPLPQAGHEEPVQNQRERQDAERHQRVEVPRGRVGRQQREARE